MEKNLRRLLVILCITLCLVILIIWIMTPFIINWALQHSLLPKHPDSGTFGDQFGFINSLFSALAFAALVVAIIFQAQGLAIQRRELSNSMLEMRKAANAQTAQVRIQSYTALLGTLPTLIRQESEQLSQNKIWSSLCLLSPESMNAEDYQAAIPQLGSKMSQLEKSYCDANASLAILKAEQEGLMKTLGLREEAEPENQSEVKAMWSRKTELVREIPDKENQCKKWTEELAIARLALSSANYIRLLKLELDGTYKFLRCHRKWEDTDYQDHD